MRILFWNIMKQDATFDMIVSIADEEDVDIVAIAEMPSTDVAKMQELCNKLNVNTPGLYKSLPFIAGKEKVIVYYRNHVKIKSCFSNFKMYGKKLEVNGVEFGLVFCHLPATMNGGNGLKEANAEKFRRAVELLEKKHLGHRRTIICGDFNMNPFESGMTDVRYFNAVMDKAVANRKTRTFMEDDYYFFYNPMWGCLGDNGKGTIPGTYYYNASDPYLTYWNMLDQVIIRPDVIPYFDDKGLKILTTGLTYNLLTKQGHPDKKISDHLPILFTLNV